MGGVLRDQDARRSRREPAGGGPAALLVVAAAQRGAHYHAGGTLSRPVRLGLLRGPVRDARRKSARARCSEPVLPGRAALLRLQRLEEQRHLPQVRHQDAQERGDARRLHGARQRRSRPARPQAARSAARRLNATELLLGDEALARHGERIALFSGEERVTYAELAARMRRAAGALASFGVGPGDRVLLLMRDTPEFAAT